MDRTLNSRRRRTRALVVVAAGWLAVALASTVSAPRVGAAGTPTLNISDATPFPVLEGDSGTTTVTFSVTLTEPAVDTVTVKAATGFGNATAGSDYVAVDTLLTFAPGTTGPQQVQVTIIGDTTAEPDENFFVQLYNPTGGAVLGDRWGEARIQNDDGATPVVNVGDIAPFLEADTVVNFPVTISALPSSGSVSVRAATGYGNATPGSDYIAVNTTTVTWTSSSSLTQNVPVTIIEDDVAEPDETFWLQLYDPAGVTLGDRWGMATILNDDAPAPVISIANHTAPEGSNAALVVSLNISPPGPVSVNYASMPGTYFDTSATPGADFTAVSGTLTWAAGDFTTRTISVPLSDDGDDSEPSEHFWVQIYDPTGASLAAQRYGKGIISSAPVAVNDAHSAVGNTKLVVATTQPSEPHRFVATGHVLENDTDKENDVLTASAGSTSVNGGSVTMNADGSFTYLPAVGFTGADSFSYTVDDGHGNTATGTVNLTVANRVWYINNAGAAGDGRSSSPFNSLASVQGAGDPDGDGDHLFLFQGSGNYTGGLVLEANQRLIGQPEGLVVGADTLLAASGSNPVITNAAGAGITLASGNTIRRVNVTNPSGAGITGTSVSTADIGSNMTVSGAGGAGFNLSGNANGNVTMAAAITHSASGARSVSIANRTGGTVTVSGAVSDTAGGISLSTNSGATVNFTGGLSVSSGGNMAFSATGGGTVSATGTNVLTTSTATALNVASTTIGAAGLTFQSINSNGGTNGIVLNATGSTGGLTVAGTGAAGSGGTIQNKSGDGISLTNVGGVVSLTNMATSNVTGADVLLSGGAANFTYAGTITNQATKGRSVDVSGRTGGTAQFSGLIDDDASGISLTNNTGATVNFTGGVDLNTGSNAAFTATGGGTVNVTGSANVITTTTGTALNVANTTIGASNLNFRSINSNGGASGIILNNTGSSGGLTVSGTGAAGSGGTIQNKTGDAISLTTTRNVSLTSINVLNNLGSGINGSNVTNFTLASSTIDNNGDDGGADEAGIRFNNLLGTASITNSTIANSIEDNVRVLNSSGTLSQLTISGTTIRDTETVSPGNNGLLIQANGTASITADITTSSFLRNRANGIQVVTNDSGTIDVEIGVAATAGSGGTFTDNNIGVNIAHNSSGNLSFDVHRASLSNPNLSNGASPINLNRGATGSGTFSGTVSHNTITNNNSTTGPGIRIVGNGASGTMTVKVDSNNVSQIGNFGIEVLNRDANTPGMTINATIVNNTVNLASALATEAIRVNAGATSGPPADSGTICADIRGNTASTAGAGLSAIRVRQRFSTTFILEGYAGVKTDDAAVAAFLTTNNNGSTATADHSASGSAGFLTTANCPEP